ncbi:MAG: SO_0444 family Cu/Zn efflux transporter [Candidatus Omnitrophica bacterium]|nr:SO_0444 family Cu/Zn efflux transporter [Candidatus Omnitrophota bacterium]
MSFYLFSGFLIAGILKVLIAQEQIYYHLSPSSFLSILKSTPIGIPFLVGCCGLIPVATHIKKEGASNGFTISFLIFTPPTGVDSILFTYFLLGRLLAIIRPSCAIFSGIFAGLLVNRFGNKDKNHDKKPDNCTCNICEKENVHTHSFDEKIRTAFRYGFFEFIEDTGKWILAGIIIGGIISTFVPEDMVSRYLGKSLYSYPLMLLIGIPLYLCVMGFIPIAASLILKGMSPGAGFVILLTRPATNSATRMFVFGKLGRKNFFIYLFSIVLWAVIFGLLIDHLWTFQFREILHIHRNRFLPLWLKVLSSCLLMILILRTFHFKRKIEM